MSTKSKMGRPPVDSEMARARLERSVLDALDRFAGKNSLARPEAMRRIIRTWLQTAKLLPSHNEVDAFYEGDGPHKAKLVGDALCHHLPILMESDPPQSKAELLQLVLDILHDHHVDVPVFDHVGRQPS